MCVYQACSVGKLHLAFTHEALKSIECSVRKRFDAIEYSQVTVDSCFNKQRVLTKCNVL